MRMVEVERVIQDCECAAAHVALRTSTACEKGYGLRIKPSPKTEIHTNKNT